MQPAASPRVYTSRSVDPRVQLGRIRFRRALALMVMTLVLPGSAQLVSGNRRTARVAMRTWFAVIGAGVLFVLLGLVSHTFVFWFASNTFLLGLLRFALMGMAIGWAYLFVDAWRLGNPLALRQKQRLAMVGINGLLCFSVAGSLLFGAHVVNAGSGMLTAMFASGDAIDSSDGRYNVLLLGADTGADRWGTRIDSINVASIDAKTGKTVLMGLPRNMMNFPFAKGSIMAKQFPDGYLCDSACRSDYDQSGRHELNSLTTWVADHKALFKGVAYPGVEATKEAVEGITGLKIQYFAMVNLGGFQHMVDAVGGVTLHVRDRIPIGGVGAPITGWIKPGTRKLDGFHALWFARSRASSDDYSRMARQKCVLSAMLTQLNPSQVMLHIDDVANASKALVKTDLPRGEVDRFIQLALKAKSQPIKSLSFVPPMVHTSHPDIAKIQAAVDKAISTSEGKKSARKKSSGDSVSTRGQVPPAPQGSTGGAVGNLQSGYAANQTDDVGASC